MNAISLIFNGGELDKALSDISALPESVEFHCEQNQVILRIPDNQILNIPIHFKYLNGCTGLQRRIVVGENSLLSLIEEYESSHEDRYTTLTQLGWQLHKNARTYYYKIQNENEKAQHHGKIEVAQEEASTMNMFFADCGSNKSLSDVTIKLEGRSAACFVHGLYFLNHDTQDIEHAIHVDHLAEYGVSSMIFKGVLDKKSKAKFKGKVHVHERAQHTNAHQENHNLLLSSTAEVASEPQLEIYADDIKCAHGATVGQLDQDSLFYLRSRGIDAATALKILTDAFVSSILEKVENTSIRYYIQQRVAQHDIS